MTRCREQVLVKRHRWIRDGSIIREKEIVTLNALDIPLSWRREPSVMYNLP